MNSYPSTHKTLLERIQAGDEISWQEFYDRYSPVVVQAGGGYGLSPEECQDLLQNLMLKFFQHDLVMKYDSRRARFRTYFNQILCSCIYDFLRMKKQQPDEVATDQIPDEPVPAEAEEMFLEEWRSQMLQEALERLRKQVKAETFLAFHLTVFQKKSPQETADFLKISTNMVYVARTRCIKRLRSIIDSINREDPALELKWNQPK